MIIQFSHNGKELNLSRRSVKNGQAYRFNSGTTGYRYWNNENEHKRKFLKYKGWYLRNMGDSFSSQPQKDDLYFWGEWEPQSRFELTGNPFSKKAGLPHAVHCPLFSSRGVGAHNTDPFVFGERFYYTNCKQKQTRNGKMMLNLVQDSIILFGSEINKSDFVIDTVFVIKDSETVADYHKHPNNYPSILRQATIDLNGGLANWHRLYDGKMYDFNNHYSNNNTYSFCFFPCKTDCGNTGFERPIINWNRFNFKKPGAGTVLYSVDYKSESDFWHDLVAELINQGFSLGIKLDMPINNDYEDFPEYENNDSKCNKRC